MRFQLIVWVILFVLGVFVGDRYGLPGWARGLGDSGFSAVESWFGKINEPIPEAEDEARDELEENGDEDGQNAEDADAPDSSNTPPAPASSELGNAANAGLRMNDAGLQIIEESEGLRLEAYNAGGQWLIGYGHSRTAEAGMTITQAQAEQLLREDVRGAEAAVRKLVLVPVNENQFSAMASLAYNLGEGGFTKTTVLERINSGDYNGAADGFLIHDRVRMNGELQSVPHLTERREKERALFLTPA